VGAAGTDTGTDGNLADSGGESYLGPAIVLTAVGLALHRLRRAV
jgi:hypothetical protein